MANKAIYRSGNEKSPSSSSGPFFMNLSNHQQTYKVEQKTQFIGDSHKVGDNGEEKFNFSGNKDKKQLKRD